MWALWGRMQRIVRTCCSLEVIRHCDTQLDAKKRATTAADKCLKVDNVCNVVVIFRTATVGSRLHILPCGTVYIANLHSQTSTHTKDQNHHYAKLLASFHCEI